MSDHSKERSCERILQVSPLASVCYARPAFEAMTPLMLPKVADKMAMKATYHIL